MSSAFSFLVRMLHPVPLIRMNYHHLNLYYFFNNTLRHRRITRRSRRASSHLHIHVYMQLPKNHINPFFGIFSH